MRCPQCGTTRVAGADLCGGCGASFAAGEAATLFAITGGRGRPTMVAAAAWADESGAATRLIDADAGASGGAAGATRAALLEAVRRDLGADYDVEREIGRGGMAVVYQAVERELRRPVALKVLPPELAFGGSMADRFKREARMAASLDHPNIIPVYRVGQAGTTSFMAMKLVDGRALDAVIASQGPLPVPVALLLLRGAADALAYAHEHGIVHRDVKPANIMLDGQGRPLVTDFGVARAVEDASMTAPGSVIGTPWFMSPEQCGGKGSVGPQSDQYSLGVVAFQLLTGRVPFDAATLAGIMQHHFFTPVPDVRLARPEAPAGLVEVISRALSKDPRHRYGTTADMVRAIDAIPLSDADRRWGESMLRQLALGASIPAVSAGVLPTLAERERPADGGTRQMMTATRWALSGAIAVATLVAWTALSYNGPASALPAAPPRGVATSARGATGAAALRLASEATAPPAREPAVRPASRDERAATPTRTAPARRAAPGAAEITPVAPPAGPPSGPPAERPLPERRVASGKVRVRTYPADAEIFIDDAPVGRGVVIDAVVPAGARRLRVTAPGYPALDTTFTVVAGETAQLGRLTLRAPEGAP